MIIVDKFKNSLKKMIFGEGILFRIFFYYRHGYFPKVKNPVSFNEKINLRKREYSNPLFAPCSDKVDAKEYARKIIGDKYIIPTLGIYERLTKELLESYYEKYGSFVVKTNHDSGGVFVVEHSSEDFDHVAKELNERLKFNESVNLNEKWYGDISPKILFEEKLTGDIFDYKFHMFKKKNNQDEFNIVLQIDIGRGANHSRTLVDEEFNWLPFHLEKPCIYNKLQKPKSYDSMIDLSKKLAQPFSYVRVDLYNVDGDIYFGEMTFSHGSGNEVFASKGHDVWMGKLWELDPRI